MKDKLINLCNNYGYLQYLFWKTSE